MYACYFIRNDFNCRHDVKRCLTYSRIKERPCLVRTCMLHRTVSHHLHTSSSEFTYASQSLRENEKHEQTVGVWHSSLTSFRRRHQPVLYHRVFSKLVFFSWCTQACKCISCGASVMNSRRCMTWADWRVLGTMLKITVEISDRNGESNELY